MSQDYSFMKKVSFPSSRTGPLGGNLYLKQLLKANGGSSLMSLKDKNTTDLFTPRDRRNPRVFRVLKHMSFCRLPPTPSTTRTHTSREFIRILKLQKGCSEWSEKGQALAMMCPDHGLSSWSCLLKVSSISVLFGHSQHLQYPSLVGK